jgi:hypothetical protein
MGGTIRCEDAPGAARGSSSRCRRRRRPRRPDRGHPFGRTVLRVAIPWCPGRAGCRPWWLVVRWRAICGLFRAQGRGPSLPTS